MTDKTNIQNTQNCWPSTTDAGGHQGSAGVPATESRPNTEHCMVCGSSLDYHELATDVVCSYCGKIEHGHITCPSGHYVCDACHNRDAMQIIENIALATKSPDPFEISELMMSSPTLPMLGCQHAYIAGGALMAAIKNEGSRGITEEHIREVFRRTEKQAHGGYCGLTGVCGIAPAIGACFAVLTGSKCGKDEEQKITMEAVTRISRAITDLTGPSCCKAYVRTSLLTAALFLKERFDIALPMKDASIKCYHNERHPHGCRETKCPYFQMKEGADTMSAKPMDKYDEFFSMTYLQGAMDVKTKHLVALGASLGAGCQPWTEYCLAVARQQGATDPEINEVVSIAMTIGAHKIRLMAETGQVTIGKTEPSRAEETSGSTWTPKQLSS